MAEWLEPRDVDILCLQEVRAPDAIVRQLLGDGWFILHEEAEAKGRAGVAIASRTEPLATRSHIGDEYFATTGRWVEADFRVTDAAGAAPTDSRQRLRALRRGRNAQTGRQVPFPRRDGQPSSGAGKHSDHVLVVGDLNVGHTELDIRNWKGNVKRSGFLPEERAYFDRFFGEEIGYKDVHANWRARSTARSPGGRGGAGFRQRRRVAHRLPHGHPGTCLPRAKSVVDRAPARTCASPTTHRWSSTTSSKPQGFFSPM